MTVLLGVGLLLVAMAVVLLFAMMGELTSRLPDQGRDRPGTLQPLTEFNLGVPVPDRWPGALSVLDDRQQQTLIVLSPVCSSCARVAAECARYGADKLEALGLGIVVSCASVESGENFIREYSLGGVPHAIDEGGAWVMTAFGVKVSPTALLFENGTLSSAYAFNKLDPLRERIMERGKVRS